MTTAHAIRMPEPAVEQHPLPRHLDIAPTRAQKRARPRIYAALVAVGGIGVILLAQLLMSIVLADGAYQITSLQREQRDIGRDQNAAQERLEELSSTQSLIDNATTLGMVSSGNPIFLDVASGQALGVPAAPRGQIVGSGGNLIGNALLADGSTKLDPAAIAAAQAAQSGVATLPTTPTATTTTGTPESGVAPVSGSTGTLPSPTTR